MRAIRGELWVPQPSDWQRELIETYRHLREHGNSSFIFLLELGFAALLSCVIKAVDSGQEQLAIAALLFGLWTASAMFVHFLAQRLERQFSQYDSAGL